MKGTSAEQTRTNNKLIEIEIIAFIRKEPFSRIKEIADYLDKTVLQMAVYLNQMQKFGTLKRRGKCRSYEYYLPKKDWVKNHWTD